jgi:hypothetical protein
MAWSAKFECLMEFTINGMVQKWSRQPFGNRYYPMLAEGEYPLASKVGHKKQLSTSGVGTITVIGFVPSCAKCTFLGLLGHRRTMVPEI